MEVWIEWIERTRLSCREITQHPWLVRPHTHYASSLSSQGVWLELTSILLSLPYLFPFLSSPSSPFPSHATSSPLTRLQGWRWWSRDETRIHSSHQLLSFSLFLLFKRSRVENGESTATDSPDIKYCIADKLVTRTTEYSRTLTHQHLSLSPWLHTDLHPFSLSNACMQLDEHLVIWLIIHFMLKINPCLSYSLNINITSG